MNDTNILKNRFDQIIQENADLKTRNEQIQELCEKESSTKSQEIETLKTELVSLKANILSSEKNVKKLESKDQISKTTIRELKSQFEFQTQNLTKSLEERDLEKEKYLKNIEAKDYEIKNLRDTSENEKRLLKATSNETVKFYQEIIDKNTSQVSLKEVEALNKKIQNLNKVLEEKDNHIKENELEKIQMRDEFKKKKEAHKKYIEEIFRLELVGMDLKRDNERVINEAQILQGRFDHIIQENMNLKSKNKQIQELHKKESSALSQENETLKEELVSLKVNLLLCEKISRN